MPTLLFEPSVQREIKLEDGIYYAKIQCITTKFLLPQLTKIDLEVIETIFLIYDKVRFEQYWSIINEVPVGENIDSHLTRHLRILFKTEAKPTFTYQTF